MAAFVLIAATGVSVLVLIVRWVTRVLAGPDVRDFSWPGDRSTRSRAEIDAIVDSATDEQIARLWADLNDPNFREVHDHLDVND